MVDEVRNLEFILQHMQEDAHDSHESRSQRHYCQLTEEPTGNVANHCMNDTILPSEEGRGISFAQSFLRDGALFRNSKRELLKRWETYVARYEKLKGEMDDEIKRGWPGIFGAGGAWEALDFQLHSFKDVRGCTLGDRNVRGGEIWIKNSQT